MASTSRLKKRKGTGRMDEIDQLGTDESGSTRNSLDGSDRQNERSIQARCSPTRFVNLCTKLKNEFRMVVREMGFSSLLEMSSCTIFRPLVGWLIENFNVEDASLCVHGKTFMLDASSFEMVMGVKDGGEDFEQEGSLDDVKRRRAAVRDGNATLSLTQLENNLIEAESVDDLFVTRFVLLITVGTLLMPTTSVYVGTSIVGSITGSESVRKKNWATKSFTYLVDAIRDFKEKKGAFIGGCVLFLQVFYLHHLEGHNQYVERSILPMAAWTEKKSKDVIAWINEGSGFGSEKIRMRETNNGCYKCQSMQSDMNNMMMEIKKSTSEIQELKQFVSGLQQCIQENVKKEIAKVVTDFVEVYEGDREAPARENWGSSSMRNNTIVLDDDESESGFQSWSDDIFLQACPVAIYKDFVNSGGYKIGPFELTQLLSDTDLRIAMYIFDETLNEGEPVAEYGATLLYRSNLLSLKPRAMVSNNVIDAYAKVLNGGEGKPNEIHENQKCWFLPSLLSIVASFRKVEGLPEYLVIHKVIESRWRKCFGNLSKCTKIVIPVLNKNETHWFTAVVNLREANVQLWDSMAVPPEELHDAEETVIEILRLIDGWQAGDIGTIYPNGLSLQSFKVIHKRYVQVASIHDSAIYAMMHMWAATKGLDSIPEFNPEEYRLQVAIELVLSRLNTVRNSVLEKCSLHFDWLVRESGGGGC